MIQILTNAIPPKINILFTKNGKYFSEEKANMLKARELLIKARATIQVGKRKKLDKIMTLFLKDRTITNDEVEKFLRVSDKTAERYLNALEKENRIKQVGKTGHAVSYVKILD